MRTGPTALSEGPFPRQRTCSSLRHAQGDGPARGVRASTASGRPPMLKIVQKSALAVALIGLAACSSASSIVSKLWPFGGGMETKAYACDDGSRMIVVFDNREEAASVSITGRPMQTLHRQS